MHMPRMAFAGVVSVAVWSVGCASEWHASSPWEWGPGIRAAPMLWTLREGTTVHPMASYSYLSFDGGHDDRFELGGQVRQTTSLVPMGSRRLWVGGEAAFAVLRTNVDGFDSQSTNGWSTTALAGLPVGDTRWGLNVYAGAGVSNYGSSGRNLRIGVDLQPWFLQR